MHQHNRARLEKVLVFFHYACGNSLEALMHGIQSDLPLLPFLVLTLFQYDRFISIECFLGGGCVNFNAFERTLTEVDDVNLLASSKHLGKAVATPARHIHLLIMRLLA